MAETTRSETFLEALKGIQDALAAFQGIALELFITLAGVGVLTMAVLQLLKELLPVRRWYQQYQFRKWLGERIRKVRLSQSKHYEPEGLRIRDQAYEDILKLSMSGDEKALFELPPGQLVGQMGIASQLVLDHPEQYENIVEAINGIAPYLVSNITARGINADAKFPNSGVIDAFTHERTLNFLRVETMSWATGAIKAPTMVIAIQIIPSLASSMTLGLKILTVAYSMIPLTSTETQCMARFHFRVIMI